MLIAGVVVAVGSIVVAALPFGGCPPLLSPGSGAICPQAEHAAALWLTGALAVAVPLVITGLWLAIAVRIGPPLEQPRTGADVTSMDHQQV
jgi:hypothetical protein